MTSLPETIVVVVVMCLLGTFVGILFNKILPLDKEMMTFTFGRTWIGLSLAMVAVLIPLHLWSEG